MDMELFFAFIEWEQIFEALHYRGRVGFDNSIEYVIHSNEQGHNKAHLHARYQQKEIVLEIPSGIIITGNLPMPKAKQASQWVQKNSDLLIKKWNELSNGIRIPVR